MGLALTQVVTEDRASGAQIIDGSLRFDGSSYLTRTPSTSGNLKTWTWSAWVKRSGFGSNGMLWSAHEDLSTNADQVRFLNGDFEEKICVFVSDAGEAALQTSAVYRDPSAWMHVVIRYDTTQSTAADRIRIYVNGSQTPLSTSVYPSVDYAGTAWNRSGEVQAIGCNARLDNTDLFNGYISQVHHIDGQSLTPSYFGFTDPLTNTWRPKKYEGTYGTNGFWLPMDGNSPIGKDMSGNGNDFTPAGFGGSNSIEKATGALPILNTTNGGNVATVGVRTDSNYSNLVLALPLVGTDNDVSNQINSGSSTKTITNTGATATSTVSNCYGGSFDFDGSNDDLTWSITGGLGSGDFTIEYWVYQDTLSDYQTHLSNTRGSTGFNVGTDASGDFVWYDSNGGGSRKLEVVGAITTGRWYHWAFVRSGSTITGYIDGVEKGSFSSSVDYSASAFSLGALDSGAEWTNGKFSDVRIYVGVAKYTSNFIPASTNPDILPDTPSGVAGGSALATLSESTTGGSVYFDGSADYLSLANSTDFDVAAGDFTAEGYFYFTNQSSTGTCFFGKWADTPGRNYALVYIKSDNKYRFSWSSNGTDETLYTTSVGYPGDVNRWVHLAVVRNGTTLKIYRDGEEILSSSIGSSTIYNSSTSFMVGRFQSNTNYDYSGWISNFRFVKGTAVYTAEFTPPTSPLTNITNTKLLCCKNSSSATDSVVTPGTITANGTPRGDKFRPFQGEDINLVRGQESGYATFNPVAPSGIALSDGNLSLSFTNSVSEAVSVPVTMGATSGKFYVEFEYAASGSGGSCGVGVVDLDTAVELGGFNAGWTRIIYLQVGVVRKDNTNIATGLPTTRTAGDIVGIDVDCDAGQVRFYVNGTLQHTETGLSYGRYGFHFEPNIGGSANTCTVVFNAGQKPFKYAPPEGSKTLCLANLPRPTKAAVRPDKYFNTVLWTGNGTARSITGLGFQPDLVWFKIRSSADSHAWYDSVRGVQERLQSDSTAAEGTQTQALSAFDSDGWSMGTDSQINASSSTYVAWAWKAGGAAVSNTDGSITSSVSANQDAGFSIVSYTGTGSLATVGHGLNEAPDMVITKPRDGGDHYWGVYHRYGSSGAQTQLQLQTTTAPNEGTSFWNGTHPTSTVFTVNTASGTNNSGSNIIAYCWHSVPGFSKFGSYTGNGNSDGPFIYCGFNPAWVMIKDTTGSANSWYISDNKRNTYNVVNGRLMANLSNGESTSVSICDFTANGFKIRTNDSGWNTSGSTYIYAAFAEAPTNNLFGGQANAR